MEDITDQARHDTRQALLYELRLLFANCENKEFSKEEILEKIDSVAMSKE